MDTNNLTIKDVVERLKEFPAVAQTKDLPYSDAIFRAFNAEKIKAGEISDILSTYVEVDGASESVEVVIGYIEDGVYYVCDQLAEMITETEVH